MTFKFRRSLEPYVNPKADGPRRTALKPQGNLLIGFSGGLGSTVLLDLIHRYYVVPDKTLITDEGGSNHPRNERVWQRVIVCYVEVCDAFPAVCTFEPPHGFFSTQFVRVDEGENRRCSRCRRTLRRI